MRTSMFTTKIAKGRDRTPKKKRGPGSLAKAYLVLYNVIMTVGWLTIAMVLVRDFLATRSLHGGYYHSVETLLKVFQTAAVLEVLHSAAGIVPSSVALTTVQVASRLFVTWGVTHSVGEVQCDASVLMFLAAWTVTELVRYPFYTSSLAGRGVPGLLKWARYSLFVVLYPVGVAGELLTMYRALPYVQSTGLYSVALPAEFFGASFNYHAFLVVVMASYVPLFPRLYLHMLRQRKKVLGHAKDHKSN